jgi:pyruvate/2-oxoglutarate dehydrogenase complex dihydrolipoamide dehydrogenase (E3) component
MLRYHHFKLPSGQRRAFHKSFNTMANAAHYNALILGSGQAGTPLAVHLRSLGQTVCLVERSHIAGCCVNEGCTPTKTMVASGRIAYLARRAVGYGVAFGGGEVKVDMLKVRQRKRDIVNSFRGGSEKKLVDSGVDVLLGTARFTGEKEIEVSPNDGGAGEKDVKVTRNDSGAGQKVTADGVFINVGCRPVRPDIPGLDSIDRARVLDSTNIQELGEVPEHLVVIGGGAIGLEFGQLFRRFGSRVTIVQRSDKLLGRMDDPEVADCLQEILEGEGLEVLLNSGVAGVSNSSAAGELPITMTISDSQAAEKTIQASHILLATGRIPNTDTLNLSAANIAETSTGHIRVSPKLETNIDGIYAMGDVKGGPAFTHVSYDDFRIIRDNLFPSPSQTPPTKPRTTTEREPFIPSVIYTDPQYAHIGPSLPALPRSKTYISYSMPASWIARGLETAETRGMLKAIIDPETNRIVSFSAVAVEGGEIMNVVQMAMLGLTWMDLRDGLFAHPGWSESLNNLWGGERKEVRGMT